jgi:hypothetical protein
MPESLAEAAQDNQVRALRSDLPAPLVDQISARVSQCRAALADS